jgi:hypothetical protein
MGPDRPDTFVRCTDHGWDEVVRALWNLGWEIQAFAYHERGIGRTGVTVASIKRRPPADVNA